MQQAQLEVGGPQDKVAGAIDGGALAGALEAALLWTGTTA
jgi:hypothetical protein